MGSVSGSYNFEVKDVYRTDSSSEIDGKALTKDSRLKKQKANGTVTGRSRYRHFVYGQTDSALKRRKDAQGIKPAVPVTVVKNDAPPQVAPPSPKAATADAKPLSKERQKQIRIDNVNTAFANVKPNPWRFTGVDDNSNNRRRLAQKVGRNCRRLAERMSRQAEF